MYTVLNHHTAVAGPSGAADDRNHAVSVATDLHKSVAVTIRERPRISMI
ncbi:hypothetical protein ACFY9S_24640 [Streptomyces sp. NPDC012474]